MEVSFSKNPEVNPATPVMAQKPVIEVAATVVTETTPAAAPVAAAPAPAGAVATRPAPVLGDFLPSFSDIIMPRLNLVQFSGELKDNFEPGSIIYNQQTALFIPAKINEKDKTIVRASTPPITVTFAAFGPTRYVEKVTFGEGQRGLLLKSEAEVLAAGGTLDYNEWMLKKSAGMKRFEYLAETLVVVERPEIVADDDAVFNHEVDGKKYALALWSVKGTAYTNLCKRILFPARRTGNLRQNGYPSWNYTLSSREQVTAGNKYFIPFAMARAKSTPAMMEFVREILLGPTSTDSGTGEA